MSPRRRRGNTDWDGDPDHGYQDDDWTATWRGSFFPPSRPLETVGGIRARSRRGAFGERWWSHRWVAVIESFQIGGRLARGKTYARSGQVVDVRIELGRAVAEVQGSRREPYSVVVALRPLEDAEWERIVAELRQRPLVAALLAAGVLHEQLELAFEAAGVSLFPAGFGELSTKCTCPDWSNPCKHVAAVFYLIAEELDRDGMLLLQLRGVALEQLGDITATEPARGRRAKQLDRAARPRAETRAGAGAPGATPEQPGEQPLPAEAAEFWTTPASDELPLVGDVVSRGGAPAAVVYRLGAFPLWRGEEAFMPLMERRYAVAAESAATLLERLVQARS